ncbi:acetylxylan esterase [Aeoliella sp. ICT_H6.2]|uniref:Acetylxylan esterase n=1 Tax=Aeoliella straminimaris TaxID=2954799 RepID=A0A9X2FB13_9BACT|nr:acetylxylan esterase [Aeoliella straminimaris]MCO6044903.1 acetylxylan esterase [Aeoliella straminimaris]
MLAMQASARSEERQPGDSWKAPQATIQHYAARRPGTLVREELVPDYELPPVLTSQDGSQTAWPSRRAELMRLFREHVYGQAIPKPASLKTDSIRQTKLQSVPGGVCHEQRVMVEMPGGQFSFNYLLYAVESEQRPVFVMINNRDPALAAPDGENFSSFIPVKQILDAGFALAVFQHSDIAPDNGEHFREGVLSVVLPSGPRQPNSPGAITAWSWGASRVLDTLANHPLIDASRAAIIGHSRGGKTALWTGAQDPRFSLVISNNSGSQGAALTRRQFGERIDNITGSFDYWFCPNLQKYAGHESELPIDQHQLIALSAPRHVYVASADEDLWADPRGEWLGLANAHPAFKVLGVESVAPDMPMPGLDEPQTVGATSYHARTGGHNLTEWDWGQYLSTASQLWNED